MTTLRAAQKRRTRELLLANALEVFAEKGYAATTIDDIVTATGTNRTTFYAHFPSRSELMKELVQEVDKLFDPDASRLTAMVQSGDPVELRSWIANTSNLWKKARPYLNISYEAAAIDAEIRATVDRWLDDSIDHIRDGLDRAERYDADTRKIRATLAFAQLEFLARRWIRHGWGDDSKRSLELLADSWEHLLFK